MLNLLKRDLKLHWDVLVVPYLVLILVSGAISLAHKEIGGATLVLLGILFIPVLPMTIHLREMAQDTLGEVISLPISRTTMVGLRYLEVLILTSIMLLLGHLATWLAISFAAHRFEPFRWMDRSGVFGVDMMLLICFAYPMPFALRWNGKGLVIAYALLYGAFAIPGLFLSLSRGAQAAFGAFIPIMRFFDHLASHPAQATLGIAVVFAISYLLSLKAFASRDF